MRSFYGALRVVQSGLGLEQQRTLFHGRIEHGAQFLLLPKRRLPTTYYAPDSGIGIALRECVPKPKKVGIIGLGVGTLAAYGEPGDDFRFFEINPQVLQLAEATFFYLRETNARVHTEIGDARLTLQDDHTDRFDLLAVDAFSGDAIPVHLLTREALRIYFDHLRPDGIIAFHVSNNYLDLAAVVNALAKNADVEAQLFRNHDDPDTLALASDWVLVTRNTQVFDNAALKVHRIAFSGRRAPLWTDENNDLISVFKMPSVH
jgi:SAM-dependent methyltransferase